MIEKFKEKIKKQTGGMAINVTERALGIIEWNDYLMAMRFFKSDNFDAKVESFFDVFDFLKPLITFVAL